MKILRDLKSNREVGSNERGVGEEEGRGGRRKRKRKGGGREEERGKQEKGDKKRRLTSQCHGRRREGK